MCEQMLVVVQGGEYIVSLDVTFLRGDDFLEILDGWAFVVHLPVQLAPVEDQVYKVPVNMQAIVSMVHCLFQAV